MKTPLSWIKDFVPDLNCTDREFVDAMTMSGTKCEGYERLDKNLEKIVVGRIEKIEPHPDADKLIVCQVNVGGETIQIVTGANNVSEGDLVPVVLDGGKVAGGHDGGPLPEDGIKIKAGKLRGVESYGMMCSIEELGSSRDVYPEAPEEGIYLFDSNSGLKPGDDAIEALGLRDTVFDYEITSNRVDCYAIMGVAREAAATFDLPFRYPDIRETGSGAKASDFISVEIEDKDLCSRYIARVVKNIKIGESPEWMKKRLRACGIRPISNIVDITNFVMLEYGQPMHAFDLSTIAGGRIVVKRAKDGDTFTTLDGEERKLDHDVLTICDGEKAVALAGIMGGENSMITDSVHDVLFEAATFNGANIRKSSRRIGLRTDSSGIFEKGLDPNNAYDAMERACSLIEELGCGEVQIGRVDVHGDLPEKKRIAFEPERINEYLGTDIDKDTMLSYFKRLEVGYDKDSNELVVPTFRQDLIGFADSSEEVARIYGYDRIPTTLPKDTAQMGSVPFKIMIENLAKNIAISLGFSQGYCYSFESPDVFDKLRLPEDAPERKAIQISNPLGVDFSIMRTLPLNGILSSLSTNYNRRNENVKLFELANIYLARTELPITDYPDERMQFTLGAYGDTDFYDMKGVVEEFIYKAGMKERIKYQVSARPYLHPGRQADILYDNTVIGYLGQVHPLTAKAYDMAKTEVYIAVLDMPEIVSRASFEPRYMGLAKYPSVSRDLSMVVPKKVQAQDIDDIIVQRGGKILESFRLFDIYEGEQIGEDCKSMAYTVVFRDKDKTLSDDDIAAAMKKILNGLQGLGIELRS
ncbi:MAG TPA: phenylalanine--tRNA ligase subunit beta [Lachnospiraceae bacterium]|nr:phenylalanine--tRNA ligase subunit beta [Lachnospiraceae bacterium]